MEIRHPHASLLKVLVVESVQDAIEGCGRVHTRDVGRGSPFL